MDGVLHNENFCTFGLTIKLKIKSTENFIYICGTKIMICVVSCKYIVVVSCAWLIIELTEKYNRYKHFYTECDTVQGSKNGTMTSYEVAI